MAAGLVDRSGALTSARRLPTAVTRDAEVLWSALADLVKGVLDNAPLRPVVCGVGCGGPMTVGGEAVSPLNIPAWRDFPLRQRLTELSGIPTFVDNDAKALALAEGWVGAAAGCKNFMAMVVSTGVGGGIVLDGRLLDGRGGNAGHIGHVVVEPDGHRCGCGAIGCLEAEASGTAIAAITGRPASEAPPEIVARTGVMVGRAVASAVNLLDLPLTVVAGSVALGFAEPFFAAAGRELAARAKMDFSKTARIVPAGCGAEGPLIGAGAVGWRGLDRVAVQPTAATAATAAGIAPADPGGPVTGGARAR